MAVTFMFASRRLLRCHRVSADDILASCLQKRLPGNAVTLERRTDDGARINDDQCRRSAL